MNEHESGLPNAIDRAVGHPEQQSVVFYGTRRFIQKGELNELQTIIRGRHDRLGRLVAKEGDRIERADAIVDHNTGKVTLLAGKIYVAGDIFPVAEAMLENVPMTGRTEIGVKLSRKWITSEDDPELLGQEPGSLAEGEPGAARETISIAWALSSSDNDGEFFPVYVLLDGTILDQRGPSLLEPAMQAIATYDRAHGHYVVSGCRVTALGADAGRQIFSIEEGEANISGFKRTRKAALRYAEAEDWDEAAVPGETHTYPGGDRYTFAVDQYPIGVINSILLTKEKTVSVTRGAVSAGQDGLPDNSVVSIIQVRQGSKIYVEGKDYIRTGNTVDWAPAGDEPAPGSSYEVTYRYRAGVTADEHNDREVTVSGGAAGGDIIISYTYKMPRIDRIGLQTDGAPVYIKGISASANPMPPIVPEDVLSLATITNSWMDKPAVKNDAYRSIPYAELQRFCDRIGELDRLLQLERLKSGIDSREPVAKKGMFIDPFLDHSYRDEGSPQTAAVGRGIIELPITSTFYHLPLDAPVTLDWEEDIIVRQELITACTKINPYANFEPLPVDLSLNPAADFWTERRTDWAEGVTNEFWQGGRTRGPLEEKSTADELVSQRQEQIRFLRQIDISFEIRKLGKGEVLESLTFDGINIKPEGEQAAGPDGIISGTLKIPENVPSGTKEIIARTKSGSNAVAMFTGQGTIEVDVMRRVTTVRRWWRVKADPQAQVFMPDQPRQIVGVDFHICKLGDPAKGLLIEQVTTDNGYPTTDIVGQASFDMTAAPLGWSAARYDLPVTTPADGLSAFVIKTDDNEHSVSLAKLGEFDEEKQQWVTSHPYVVGPRFSSVNAETWTAHQDETLAFRIIAARYPVTIKTIDLGSIDLAECSDLQVRAAVELPSADCSVVFEVERTNGTVYRLLPMQILQLTEYVTETVKLRAIIKGTEFLSPILYAPVEVIAGKIATEANYISKSFRLGENVRVATYIKAYLPGGTTFDMSIRVDQGEWQQLPLEETDELAEPFWTERKFELKNLTGHQAQLQIKITGSPAARVVAGDFGAGIF